MASGDLGIQVVAPFLLRSADGDVIEYLALVPQFGGGKGILLLDDVDLERAQKAEANGYGYSCLAMHCYGEYDRALFVETLHDWGWSKGQGPPPAWYVGRET